MEQAVVGDAARAFIAIRKKTPMTAAHAKQAGRGLRRFCLFFLSIAPRVFDIEPVPSL
jgi:hypothetical protein